MGVQCFWLEPAEMASSELRRFAMSPREGPEPGPCPINGIHDASVKLEDVSFPIGEEHMGYGLDDVAHEDPRWPKACACGYEFVSEDRWEHNIHRLLSGAPDGKLYTDRDAPPGSIFDATWWPEKGPDGKFLVVVCPPGGLNSHWYVDGPASNGGKWTRTGTPPNITVTPSILIHSTSYHAMLTNGVLNPV